MEATRGPRDRRTRPRTPSTQGYEQAHTVTNRIYDLPPYATGGEDDAYYMAGKSSMTSFAMSWRCSNTSKVPCHIVVSWYVTP